MSTVDSRGVFDETFRVKESMTFALQHARRQHLVPHWLIHLGVIGVFAVAVIDSSVIPLPLPGSTDLLVLLLAANQGKPWLLAAAATSGSLIGGYLTWSAGRKGGETMLKRYVPKRFLAPITRWVKRNGVLTIALAAILPPPIPLMPFLLSSGALGVSRNRFLIAFGLARSARYCLIVWLGVTHGRRVIRAWTHYLAGWSDVVIWTFVGLLIAAVIFGLWKYRRDQRKQGAEAPARAAS
jgi:membrane protein YqaA with SNARE-associated domain